jgi:hypothetical protein
MGVREDRFGSSLRACGARPSAKWPSDGEKAFRGQTGGRREGRFSRWDALCASVLQGRTRAEAFHFHRYVYDEPAVERRQRSGWSDAFPAGVQSLPLQGGEPGGDGLAGKTRG